MATKSKRTLGLTDEQKFKQITTEIQTAILDKELPHLYFNGFSTSISNGDVLIILKQNDIPIAVVNTSFTLAKTLAKKVGNVIVEIENRTGNTIMTTDDMDNKLSEQGQSQNE